MRGTDGRAEAGSHPRSVDDECLKTSRGRIAVKSVDGLQACGVATSRKGAAVGEAQPEDRTWIDEVADRFERAYRAGQQPRIEDYLAGAEGPRRSKLLEELLRIEREIRGTEDALPTPEAYPQRLP